MRVSKRKKVGLERVAGWPVQPAPQVAVRVCYCSGPMKFKFSFGLDLWKPFDRLSPNGSYVTGPDQ